jgi:hypothetical protein
MPYYLIERGERERTQLFAPLRPSSSTLHTATPFKGSPVTANRSSRFASPRVSRLNVCVLNPVFLQQPTSASHGDSSAMAREFIDGVAMLRRRETGQHNATSGAQPCLASENLFVRGVRQCKEAPRLLSDHGKKMEGGCMSECLNSYFCGRAGASCTGVIIVLEPTCMQCHSKFSDKRWSEITTDPVLTCDALAPRYQVSLINCLSLTHTHTHSYDSRWHEVEIRRSQVHSSGHCICPRGAFQGAKVACLWNGARARNQAQIPPPYSIHGASFLLHLAQSPCRPSCVVSYLSRVDAGQCFRA